MPRCLQVPACDSRRGFGSRITRPAALAHNLGAWIPHRQGFAGPRATRSATPIAATGARRAPRAAGACRRCPDRCVPGTPSARSTRIGRRRHGPQCGRGSGAGTSDPLSPRTGRPCPGVGSTSTRGGPAGWTTWRGGQRGGAVRPPGPSTAGAIDERRQLQADSERRGHQHDRHRQLLEPDEHGPDLPARPGAQPRDGRDADRSERCDFDHAPCTGWWCGDAWARLG